jgi:hypothetical protein
LKSINIYESFKPYINNSKTNEISFQLNSIKKENLVNVSEVDNRLSSANSSNYFRSTNYSSHFFNSNNGVNSYINNNTNNLNSSNFKSNNLNQNFSFPYYSNNYLINKSTEKKIENVISEQPFDKKRDLTSSSSSFRPKYDYSNIITDNLILKHKTNEINEKRNYEEMKEFLNEWGINKARFREEMEKKYELKNLLSFYEKNFKEKKDLENQKISTITSLNNLSKKNSPSPIKHNQKRDEIQKIKGNPLTINNTENFSINTTIKKHYRVVSSSEKIEIQKQKQEFSLKEKINKANKIFESFDRLRMKTIKNFQNIEDDSHKGK